MIRILIASLALLIVAGCLRFEIDVLRDQQLQGKTFTMVLARKYRDLAEKEAALYDWMDANHFARKGLKAAQGLPVEPENPSDWRIAETLLPTVDDARYQLVSIVDENTKKISPEASANAYQLYDCWVEELEEDWQTEHIDACRDQFFEMLDYLKSAKSAVGDEDVTTSIVKDVNDTATNEPQGNVARSIYAILFDFDSAQITDEGRAIIEEVANEVRMLHSFDLILHGHTDTAGPEAYNYKLSKKRAKAVKQGLVNEGVDDNAIILYGFGETKPAKVTADDVREPANRRVEVFLY